MIPVDAIITESVRHEPDLGAVASVDDGRLTVLLWNYHDVAGGYEDRREIELRFTGLPPAAAGTHLLEHSIDEHSGNAYTAWLALGSPQPPDAGQIAQLHAAARIPVEKRAFAVDADGTAQLKVTLPRQSVKLIEVVFAKK